ncbi:ubiquitin domain-containing protein 7SL RNA1-like [Salvia hispanica]|uniref:ubiquitin domain-containing protein 7SL RNA1-like n=1 Tax=Salvia hispanica TaxID=49212 RepID=UPI002009A0C3|nr:ubiquitin domain-containing protein 7SL RNA1-like [Salvia hispanica]
MDLIFYRSNGANPFSLEVGYFDTVLEIKEKIQKEHGFPAPLQTLVFNGAILRDDLNVHHSDILDRSRIHLLLPPDHPPSKLRLLLKLPSSPKLVALDADAKDTVRRLKEKITELELLNAPVSRIVVGNELPDHKTLGECDLGNNSEVAVGLRPGMGPGGAGGLLRVVAQYGAEKVGVEVGPGENVGELRKKLQKMNLPKEGYFFIFKQNVMDDDRSFRWHHVGPGDTIEIFSGSVSGGS